MDGKLMRHFIVKNFLFMIFFLITLVIVEFGSVAVIYKTGNFMDKYIVVASMPSHKLFDDLAFLIILLAGVLIARIVNKCLDFYLSNKGMIYVESKALDHIMHIELEEIMHRDKIELAQQINNDAVVISDYMISGLPNLIIKLMKLLLILIVSGGSSAYGAIILIVASLIYMFVFFITKSRYKKLNFDMLKAEQEYFGVLGGELLNVFLVKANSWYKRTIDRFEKVGGIFVDKSLKFLNFDFFLSNMISMLTQIMTIIIPVIMLFKGKSTPAVFFVIVTLLQMYFSNLSEVMELFKGVNRKDVASMRLNALLNLPVENKGEGNVERIKELAIDKVVFSYRTSNNLILNGENHLFKNNTITAVVGNNGSGKSTLIKVLIGLLKPSNGEVKVNHTVNNSLNMENVRKEHIAFCEQEPYLLPDTILNNLNYGIDIPKSIEYYKSIPMLDFVSNLEKGFETLISAGSNNLSGGQKQKIALVRTMVKESASLMIFDEPTSALDRESIVNFMKCLQNIKKERIILIVTHDTIVSGMADEIFKLG